MHLYFGHHCARIQIWISLGGRVLIISPSFYFNRRAHLHKVAFIFKLTFQVRHLILFRHNSPIFLLRRKKSNFLQSAHIIQLFWKTRHFMLQFVNLSLRSQILGLQGATPFAFLIKFVQFCLLIQVSLEMAERVVSRDDTFTFHEFETALEICKILNTFISDQVYRIVLLIFLSLLL